MTPPPTSIDGTDITGATIDGQDVQEITVDGDTVFTAAPSLPNSAVAQWDASALSGNDGDTINTFTDQIGSFDLSGNATLQTNGIGGVQSLSFNGSNENFTLSSASWTSLSQPNTTISVVDLQTTNRAYFLDDTTGNNRHQHRWDVDEWLFFAGSVLTGGVATQQLLTVTWDGSNSEFRADGSQVTTGNLGTRTWDSITLGSAAGDVDFWDGLIGEVVVYDAKLSPTEISSEEQRLANKWGITI